MLPIAWCYSLRRGCCSSFLPPVQYRNRHCNQQAQFEAGTEWNSVDHIAHRYALVSSDWFGGRAELSLMHHLVAAETWQIHKSLWLSSLSEHHWKTNTVGKIWMTVGFWWKWDCWGGENKKRKKKHMCVVWGCFWCFFFFLFLCVGFCCCLFVCLIFLKHKRCFLGLSRLAWVMEDFSS